MFVLNWVEIKMRKQKSGVIKRILKDHFDGFWKLHFTLFPSAYRADIEETVLKAIRCGTRDLRVCTI